MTINGGICGYCGHLEEQHGQRNKLRVGCNAPNCDCARYESDLEVAKAKRLGALRPSASRFPTIVVLKDISVERTRQETLKASGKFLWTCADSCHGSYGIESAMKLAIISEEFGEVARHVTEALIDDEVARYATEAFIDNRRYQPSKLRAELVQLAACCVAWCEALDKEPEADGKKP